MEHAAAVPFASTPGITIYYEQVGEGPPLLLISGSGGDLRRRPNLLDGPLSKRFSVLGYDQRGLGQTDAPDRHYTMAEYAGDAAALLDAVGWEQCAVFGVSFGGMVAQELVLQHPSRVARLALACTSSGGAGGASYPLHELAAVPPEERLDKAIALSDTRQPPEVAAMMQAAAGGAYGPGEIRQLEARSHHDTWDRLPQIAVPTLICGGRYDGIAPVANQEALASRIPGARLELFEGGHLFLVQDRRAFPVIEEFLLG
jgi:3-oxoadipate enol-lactonase